MGVIEASDRARKGVQMTEGKQGAAELLRGIVGEYEANGERSCSAMARMFGIDCEYETCQKCMVKMMTAIADRIDADRELPEGMEWPRFEDGELVEVGDEVGSDEPFTAKEIAFESERWLIKASSRSAFGCFHGGFGEPVNRPTPKVLDADGVPIKVGDTVFFINGNNRALTVEHIDANGGDPAVDLVYAGELINLHSLTPEKLTHERPDSWHLWGDDLDNAVKAGEVDKVEMMRRAKALAKKELQ